MKTLTEEQRNSIIERLDGAVIATPCRFMDDGCSVDVVTGQKCKRGINAINQVVYWRFSRAIAKEIAELTGTSVVFSS